MSKEELIEFACTSMDDISSIVNNLGIYSRTRYINGKENTQYHLAHGTTKQDVFKAIVDIQIIVGKINELDTQEK